MIRAHLATFPPRRRILRKVVDAILPQVDHLFVVLNDYDDVPGYLTKDPKITAIIPDRDVKDAGKFWFTPAPDDIVFTIDDDIGFSPDYVARTIAQAEALGWEGNVFGYHGNAWHSAKGWENYLFHQPLASVRGVSLIGTGTLCARGDAIAPLSAIEPYAGSCDIGHGLWIRQQGILPWVLPREEAWLTNDLPHNLWKSSLFVTVHRPKASENLKLLRKFAFDWPHANQNFDDYRPTAV